VIHLGGNKNKVDIKRYKHQDFEVLDQ